MKKISYAQLQEQYPQRIVALDQKEERVLAVGKDFEDLFQQLKKKSVDPKDSVFIGPIQQKGTINVYLSLRNQTD